MSAAPTGARRCPQVPTFSFDTRGAKEKVRKKKTPQVLFRDLRVATGAMRPLTCTACGGATLACTVLINVRLPPDSETTYRGTVERFGCSPRVLESASGAELRRAAGTFLFCKEKLTKVLIYHALGDIIYSTNRTRQRR